MNQLLCMILVPNSHRCKKPCKYWGRILANIRFLFRVLMPVIVNWGGPFNMSMWKAALLNIPPISFPDTYLKTSEIVNCTYWMTGSDAIDRAINICQFFNWSTEEGCFKWGTGMCVPNENRLAIVPNDLIHFVLPRSALVIATGQFLLNILTYNVHLMYISAYLFAVDAFLVCNASNSVFHIKSFQDTK